MCYLSDSWQIHQCEVDNVRRKDLQMYGFVTDPLPRDKSRTDVYCVFNILAMKMFLKNYKLHFAREQSLPTGCNNDNDVSLTDTDMLRAPGEVTHSCYSDNLGNVNNSFLNFHFFQHSRRISRPLGSQ